jgi:hypothetical protein
VIRRLQDKRADSFPPNFDDKFRTAVVTRRVDDPNSTEPCSPIWGTMLSMSDELELKVQAAGTMMAAAAVAFPVQDAMRYAGCSTEEIADRSIQQNVRRTADRKRKKAPLSNVSFITSTDSSSLSTFSQSQAASSITPTIRQESLPSSFIRASSIIPPSRSGERQSRSSTRRANEELLQSSQQLQAEIEKEVEGGDEEDAKPPAKKKFRKTSVQRQKTDSEACMKNKQHKEAFKLATSQYAKSKALKAGHPDKKSSKEICNAVGVLKKAAVCPSTVRRYVGRGRINVSPMKRGKVSVIPTSEWKSLRDAYSTFIMLEQANKRDECTTKKLVKSCRVEKSWDRATHSCVSPRHKSRPSSCDGCQWSN